MKRLVAVVAAASVTVVSLAGVSAQAEPRGGARVASTARASGVTAATPDGQVAASSCSAVLFVGARGSGAYGPGSAGWPSGRQKSDMFGLGSVVAWGRDRLVSDLAGKRSVQTMSIAYPAHSTNKLLVSPRLYFNGLATGVSLTLTALIRSARTCPHQQIVLAGHSQGAMVMHRVLHSLSKYPAILGRVAAAILVADGDGVPKDRQSRYGSASPKTNGIAQAARSTSHASRRKFANSQKGLVLSVCDRGDPVCDFSETFKVPNTAAFSAAGLRGVLADYTARFVLGIKRKHSAYAGKAEYRRAVDRAAALVRATPWPSPPLQILSAVVARPTEYQLQADVDRGYTTEWAAISRLPDGLSISKAGKISGIPTSTGTTTVSLIVRSAVLGSNSNWVPAQLKVSVVDYIEFADIEPGTNRVCGIDGQNDAWCWGAGPLGDGTSGPTSRFSPVGVIGVTDFTAISSGAGFSCGLSHDGAGFCWGADESGQLGDGDTSGTEKVVPTPIAGDHNFTSISAATNGCAIDIDKAAWCWGSSSYGMLGDGVVREQGATVYEPVAVDGNHRFESISGGGDHTCAVDEGGSAWCWGMDALGDGGSGAEWQYSPVAVDGGHTFRIVSSGLSASCGIDAFARAWCWGLDDVGQLGDADPEHTYKVAPVAVEGTHSFRTVSVGAGFACALDLDGKAWCWGFDASGELGDGDALGATKRLPVPVAGGHTFIEVNAGTQGGCAVDTEFRAWCWGRGEFGFVGDGDTSGANKRVPVAVD